MAGNAAAANHEGYDGAGVTGGGMSTPAQIRGFGVVTNRALATAVMAGGGAD